MLEFKFIYQINYSKNNSINFKVYLDTSVEENEVYKYKVIYGNEFGIF